MSKLKELLAELCPNGVEYKTLGEVATITRGGNFQKKDFKEQGYPCIHYGQIYTKYGLFVEKTITYLTEDCAEKQKKASKNDVIMAVTSENIEDVCKCVAWLGDTDVAVSGHTAIIHHTLNAKYLVYYLHTNDFFKQKRKLAHGTKVIEVTPDTLKSVRLPVPPLPVQEEIVRILDSFTSLTAELQTKLQAELQARQKQYEYYRDQLLTFDVHGGGASEVQWKTLGEVSDIISGFPFDSSQFTESGIRLMRGMNVKRGKLDFSESNNRYWSSYDGLEKYLLDTNDIVIAMDGSLVGKSFGVVTKPQLPLLLVQRVARIRVTGANSRYVYHCVVNSFSSYVDSKKTEGAVPHISLKDISKFKIPTPPITIQNRIAEVLDNFDAICSDLNIGLPAEIEARQKQYEYYRDRLLSFPKLT